MQADERADPVLLPRRGALFLLVPMLAIPLVFAAWGVFLYQGYAGRPAEGARVSLTLEACPEAREPLVARAKEMGIEADLGDRAGGFVLTTRLPADAGQAALIAPGLAMPGVLEVRAKDGARLLGNEGLTDATVRLDLLLQACTLLRLTPEATKAVEDYAHANPDSEVEFFVDGQRVGRAVNREMTIGELELWPDSGSDAEKINLAATRGVALDHPLPCPVAVASTAPAP